ncbi:MAG: helix-turn-helix domain-containing protein [Streptosporangiaceae bacterium]
MPDNPSGDAPASESTRFARWLDTLVPAVFESDAALARAISAPQSTILRWRRGAIPSVPYLLKLSKATGTTADVLLKIAGYEEQA